MLPFALEADDAKRQSPSIGFNHRHRRTNPQGFAVKAAHRFIATGAKTETPPATISDEAAAQVGLRRPETADGRPPWILHYGLSVYHPGIIERDPHQIGPAC